MKFAGVFGTLGLLAATASAQLQPGDLAFVGFNADGNDDIAFVTFKDIPAGDTLRFCDSEWNGTGFGSDESDFAWVATSLVPAGTVITINNLGSGVTTASTGSIILDNSGGMSTSGEAQFIFKGPSARVATTVLAAIANDTGAFATSGNLAGLAGSGLAFGVSAISLPPTTDIGMYNGSRTGMTKSGFLAALSNMSNWLLEDTGADDHNNGTAPNLPFNATSFGLITPLQPGDIAFTGFNADGADNLAFVTFKDIAANDTLRFCDSEWNGTGFGSDEGTFAWVSDSLTPAGTIITIDSLGSGVTRTSRGKMVLDTSGGMGNSDESMFLFQGTGSRAPTTFIAAIATRATSFYATPATSLAGTGLTVGSTAILLKTDVDIAAYTGPRSGKATKAEYLAALNDSLNWITQDGSGDQHTDLTAPDLPFSTTAFVFGGATVDTIKPTITAVTVPSATVLEVTFSENLDSATAVNLGNYTLTPSLAVTAAVYNKALKKVTLTHAAFVSATLYTLQVAGVKDSAGNTITTYTSASLAFTAGVIPAISFDKAYYSVKENVGSVVVRLNASAAPSDTATVQIQLASGGTAVAGTDFTFSNQTFVWPKDSAGFRTLSIPVTNNALAQTDRFFVLDLKTPVKATVGSANRLVVYLLDDDTQAPARSAELGMKFVSSYKVDTTSGASAEIVSYDRKSKRLFVMNSTRDRLEILNFKNPRAVTKVSTIDLTTFGAGGTSVAVHNGIVAVSIDAANQAPGKVVFLDTNGTVLKDVTVGSLPDMVTFSPDGKLVLTANEGQPSNDYLTDPEGSVSVIDISGGIAGLSQSNVTTMNFNAFDGQKSALIAAGVRIFGANNPTVSKDLEPEYVTVSDDSKTAWITLQEANAIAKADLVTKTITNIYPLGYKDHSLPRNALDASDNVDSVIMSPWPVKGVYMPDAIANLKVGDTTYLFTANEGDAREYGSFAEEVRVGASAYVLDSTVFPNAAILKINTNLGRLTVSNKTGDTDGDGDFDQIHVLGARSISVWNGNTGTQVWDSGDELERITSKDSVYARLFNASNDNNTFKNRSDNKGPEPEGITLGKIGSKHYAFVALERVGGVVAYDVTNPRIPRFVNYANNRNLSSTAGSDLGSEGILFIPRSDSPQDTALVVLANEVSATVSVYSVRDSNSVSLREAVPAGSTRAKFSLHRSGDGSLVLFSRPVDFKLADSRGRVLKSAKNAAWVDLKGMTQGRYFLSVAGEKSFVLMVTK